MKHLIVILLFVTACSAEPRGEKTNICGMEAGKRYFTLGWAFNGNYPVEGYAHGTLDNPISFDGKCVHFTDDKGNELHRLKASWGCNAGELNTAWHHLEVPDECEFTRDVY